MTLWYSLTPHCQGTLVPENCFSQYQAFAPPRLLFGSVEYLLVYQLCHVSAFFLEKYNTHPSTQLREPITDQSTDTISVELCDPVSFIELRMKGYRSRNDSKMAASPRAIQHRGLRCEHSLKAGQQAGERPLQVPPVV